MKPIATLLGALAALIVLSNCANVPNPPDNFDESYNRALNDSAYARSTCRLQYHDFRYCR